MPPPKILQLAPKVTANYLKDIFNCMFSKGYFLILWKRASILPLLKKTNLDNTDPNSYRPISRLPLPAKIVEKAMTIELTQFINDNKLLDGSQYGFRSQHSTELALINMSEEIREVLDKGGKTALILLDPTSAFDTVDHDLINRLLTVGIRDRALALLKSFLCDRGQWVELGRHRSWFTFPCGVPQGAEPGTFQP